MCEYPRARSAGRVSIGHPLAPLAVVLLAGAILRLARLGYFSLWYDEAASLYLGQFLTEPLALFDSARNTEAPLNALITGLWERLVLALGLTDPLDAGHDALLRLLPCAFGIANIALVYGLTRRLFQCRRSALIAACLFALSPFQIYYAQELRIYSIYVTLALLATGCMVGALVENKRRYWAGYVGLMSLMLYCHYVSMWLMFTLNVTFVALLWRHRAHFWRWTAANGLVMVLIAPALYRAFAMHAEVQTLDVPWYPSPTLKTGLITFKNFFAGYSPAAWAYWPLLLLALALWILGIVRSRHTAEGATLVACITWIPILGCVWHWGGAEFSFYEHRLFIFSGVAALIGVARGVAQCGRPGLAALGLVVALMVPGLSDHYRGRLHPLAEHRLGVFDKVDYRSAVRFVESEWRPGDRLIYANLFSAYPLFHYFHGDEVQIGWGPDTEAYLIRTLGNEPLLRGHRLLPTAKEAAVVGAGRIWYLRSHGLTFESQEFSTRMQSWFESVATPGPVYAFRGLTVQRFDNPRP